MKPLPITCVRSAPLEALRRLAIEHPAEWADVYDNESVRRSPIYQGWLRATGRHDTPETLDYFQRGFR
jgi:hypothetical protein